MLRFLVNRLVSLFITLLLIITVTFFLMHAVPGGPFTQEKKLPPAIEEALREKYHLNDPLWKQYIDYVGGVLRLDLGPSLVYEGRRVNEFIKEGFPISAKVGTYSILLILGLGIPAGVISALKQNKWQDNLVMFGATLGITIPNFVIATVLLYIFALKLGWVPTFGVKDPKGWILPAIALSGYSLSFVARLTRSTMLEVLQQDYIRTARAKGLSEGVVIFKHALKNAIIPVVSYVGPLIAGILTGGFVVERIFALPGMGRYFVISITNRDYPTIMGVTIFFAAFLMIMILIVDILYGLIDPRIKVTD